MSVPDDIGQAQRAHPGVYCAGCGRLLASDISRRSACPFCGALNRRYDIDLRTSVATYAQLSLIRAYYRRHPGWLAAQLVVILVTAALGVVGIVAGNLPSAIVCTILATTLTFLALFLPAWRDRIEEHR